MYPVKRANEAKLIDRSYDWLFLFVVGSTVGWCLEMLYRSLNAGTLTNPGFLFGPYCPIYGVGVLLIVTLCKHQKKWIAYLKIVVYSSILEYIVSFVFEQMFHELLWDYSMLPCCVGTRVSLAFSLAWGVLGVVVLYWFVPLLMGVRNRYCRQTQVVAVGGVTLIVLDTLVSVASRVI